MEENNTQQQLDETQKDMEQIENQNQYQENILENNQSVDDNQIKSVAELQPQITEENRIQAERFQRYVKETGIGMAFQIIFAEILSKKIKEDTVYAYTAMRLRQIGNDVAQIKEKSKR